MIQERCSHTDCLAAPIVRNLNTNAFIFGIAKRRDCVCSGGLGGDSENVNIPPQSGNAVESRGSDWLHL